MPRGPLGKHALGFQHLARNQPQSVEFEFFLGSRTIADSVQEAIHLQR
jgi:hypothetical protein